jgi:uncharacterized protein (DUF3084 family)
MDIENELYELMCEYDNTSEDMSILLTEAVQKTASINNHKTINEEKTSPAVEIHIDNSSNSGNDKKTKLEKKIRNGILICFAALATITYIKQRLEMEELKQRLDKQEQNISKLNGAANTLKKSMKSLNSDLSELKKRDTKMNKRSDTIKKQSKDGLEKIVNAGTDMYESISKRTTETIDKVKTINEAVQKTKQNIDKAAGAVSKATTIGNDSKKTNRTNTSSNKKNGPKILEAYDRLIDSGGDRIGAIVDGIKNVKKTNI